MPVDIKKIIENHMDGVIKSSSYEDLRKYLLEQKPLAKVKERILNGLVEENQSRETGVKLALLEEQEEADSVMAASDLHEEQEDEALIPKRRELKKTLEESKPLYEEQQKQLKALEKELEQQETDLVKLTVAIEDSIQADKPVFYAQPVMRPNPYQIPVASPVIPELSALEAAPTNAQTANKTLLLQGQHASLKTAVELTQQKIKTLKEVLTPLQKEVEKNTKELAKIEDSIPGVAQRLLTRTAAEQARLSRALARTTPGAELKALSPERRKELEEFLTKQKKELKELQDQIEKELAQSGYTSYVNQLDTILKSQPRILQHLTHEEEQALGDMLHLMENYLEIVKTTLELDQKLAAKKVMAASFATALHYFQDKKRSHEENKSFARRQLAALEEAVRTARYEVDTLNDSSWENFYLFLACTAVFTMCLPFCLIDIVWLSFMLPPTIAALTIAIIGLAESIDKSLQTSSARNSLEEAQANFDSSPHHPNNKPALTPEDIEQEMVYKDLKLGISREISSLEDRLRNQEVEEKTALTLVRSVLPKANGRDHSFGGKPSAPPCPAYHATDRNRGPAPAHSEASRPISVVGRNNLFQAVPLPTAPVFLPGCTPPKDTETPPAYSSYGMSLGGSQLEG